MSWSFGVAATETEDFAGDAKAALDAYQANLRSNDLDMDDEAVDQATTAIDVATTLVESGVVGTGKVQASLSGHANPGHAPTKSYANDTVTISVTCADPATA